MHTTLQHLNHTIFWSEIQASLLLYLCRIDEVQSLRRGVKCVIVCDRMNRK